MTWTFNEKYKIWLGKGLDDLVRGVTGSVEHGYQFQFYYKNEIVFQAVARTLEEAKANMEKLEQMYAGPVV